MNHRYEPRGLQSEDFRSKQEVHRDPRTPGSRAWDFMTQPEVVMLLMAASLISAWLFVAAWELLILGTAIYAALASAKNNKAPILPNRLPRGAPFKKDPNNRKPGGLTNYGEPEGDVFLGVDRYTNKQVWFSFKDFLRHCLATGTTGSGKTEFLVAVAYNFLCAGGNGMMFVDPKGDAKAAFKMNWIAKRFGREDDVLLCNYIRPAVGQPADDYYATTNTSNPTQNGDAKEIANILLSLLPKNEGGNNAVFADNAITLAKVLTESLVNLRDHGQLDLSWGTFREHMTLEKCLELAENKHLDEPIRLEMDQFIHAIAGVQRGVDPKNQTADARNQFGYAASYCQRGLATLTGTFGYLYGVKYGDISYDDVVRRNRILISILPSLQNTVDELRMLGKIDLFGKKQALGRGISARLEGTADEFYRDMVYRGGVPSLNIMDEYKYISVPGMAIAVTQGRSLGWSTLVGVQSYQGLNEDKEAEEFIENTNIKAIGKIEGSETFEMMDKVIGREYIARTEGRSSENASWLGYYDKQTMTYEEHSVLNKRDLKSQVEGEFTVATQDREMRIQSLFVETPMDDRSWEYREQASIIIPTFLDMPPVKATAVAGHKDRMGFYDRLVQGFKPAITAQPVIDKIKEKTKRAPGFLGAVCAAIPNDLTQSDEEEPYDDTAYEDIPVFDEDLEQAGVDVELTTPSSKRAQLDLLDAVLGQEKPKSDSPTATPDIQTIQKAHRAAEHTRPKKGQSELFENESAVDDLFATGLIFSRANDQLHISASQAMLDLAERLGLDEADVDPELMREITDVLDQHIQSMRTSEVRRLNDEQIIALLRSSRGDVNVGLA